jgi:hypothetical protein
VEEPKNSATPVLGATKKPYKNSAALHRRPREYPRTRRRGDWCLRLRRLFICKGKAGLCRNANIAGVRDAGVRKSGCERSCDGGFTKLWRGKVSLFVWALVLHAVPQRAMDVGISPHHRLMLGDRIVASASVECVPPHSIIVVLHFIFIQESSFCLSVTFVCVRPCGRCQRFRLSSLICFPSCCVCIAYKRCMRNCFLSYRSRLHLVVGNGGNGGKDFGGVPPLTPPALLAPLARAPAPLARALAPFVAVVPTVPTVPFLLLPVRIVPSAA